MSEPLSMDEEFIRNLTNLVLTNLKDENFSIENLAQESGISRITVYRKLKSIRNQDPSQFIREIRLRRAMELLRMNAGTASEIAYMVGFGSPAYFNKCFHEYFGYPPGQIKKEAVRKTEETNHSQITKIQSTKRPGWHSFVLPSSLILLLAVLLYLGDIIFFKNSVVDKGSRVMSPEKSVAVLPFRNLSDTITNQYFIDGIMEEILNNLQKIKDFRVLSRTSTDQYKSPDRPTIPEIAKKLTVNYIIEGSGQRYGKVFRLRVRLIDAKKDRQIWADSYEQKIQETKDIFKIQNQIAQAITTELKATITPEEKKLIEKSLTTNLTAYNFYQRGNYELTNYEINHYNKTALEKAEDLFLKALKYDSAFAQSYVGLAKVFWEKHSSVKEYFSENYFEKQLEYSKNLIELKRPWGQLLYPYYDMAGVYAFIGKKGKAFECLKIFNQRQRMPLWVVTFLKIDPLFNSIRSEPEFQQIIKDAEFKYQAEHERVRKWLEANNML